MSSARAYTTPEVLQWARETAGLDPAVAARKVGVRRAALLAAERGSHFLTLRQAQIAAETYGRSLATLMLPHPPDEPSVDAKYRRLRGAPLPPWSPQMIRLEREIRDRQDATVEIYAALGEEPPWREGRTRLGLPQRRPEPIFVSNMLGLTPPSLRPERPQDIWHSRRLVVRAVEWLGVLVIRQPLPDPGVRGFLLPHAEVPAIYVNSSEDARAQAFTIIHELAHLLLHEAQAEIDSEEDWCDEYAGDLLMPEPEFTAWFSTHQIPQPASMMEGVAYEFGVTPAAAAVRAARLGLIPWRQASTVIQRPTTVRESRGGNGNRNKVARLSPTFTDLVLAAADSSAVTLATAARLLRTKVEDFEKLREFADQALAE